MARITVYTIDGTITDNDKLIGTDAENANVTKNYKIGDLADFITSDWVAPGSGTLNYIPLWTPDGNTIGDSIIQQGALGQGVTIGGNLSVSDDLDAVGSIETSSTLSVTGNATFLSTITAGGGVGTAGQVLSSTGTGVEWVDNTVAGTVTGSGTLNTIPLWTPSGDQIGDSIVSQDAGATQLTVQGDLRVANFTSLIGGVEAYGPSYFYGVTQLGDAAADLIQVTGTLQLEGPIRDVNADLGNTDQILVSDAGGNVTWTDLTAVSTGTAQKTSILVKNIPVADGGVTLTKGTPVYIYGSVGASERLYIDAADASNAAKMPCVGLLDQDLSPNGEGTATVTGKLKNLITSPIDGVTPTENDTLYVKPGGGLTLTKPTGVANLIQNVGQVGRVSTSNDGNIVVSAILRSNDIPNLTQGKIWVGSTGNTIESGFVHLDESLGAMGIGTTSPTEKLTVDGNVKIIGETFQFNFTGDVEHIFSIVPSTSSFGAGSSSLKFGKNNSVTKGGGIAMGQNLISTGEQSQAFGHDNTASGPQSTAFGVNASSTGDQAFAIGNTTNATGGRAFAGGFNTAASGLNSVALGNATVASGTNAMTMGATSTATGFNCFALGLGLINSANASLAVGAYNVDSPGYKFSVGIGNSTSNRANGMAVREDGYVILDALKNSSSYNSDIAAAAGGVPLGALYRDGNTVKIRLT